MTTLGQEPRERRD